jgi:hypothetical protein
MIASGYSVGLNCDACNWTFEEIGGYESSREAWREVRRSGWKVNRKARTCICPECLRDGKAIKEQNSHE